MRAALFALSICAAATAGCGHSQRKAAPSVRHRLEHAISAGRVLGVGRTGRGEHVRCRPDPTVPTLEMAGVGSIAVFQCRAGDVAHLTFFSCQVVEGKPRPFCAIEGAPQGVRIFTTPALAAAPKDVTWNCEDEDDEGREIGPVFISLRDRPQYPAEKTEWMTRPDAQAVARAHDTRLGIDC